MLAVQSSRTVWSQFDDFHSCPVNLTDQAVGEDFTLLGDLPAGNSIVPSDEIIPCTPRMQYITAALLALFNMFFILMT